MKVMTHIWYKISTTNLPNLVVYMKVMTHIWYKISTTNLVLRNVYMQHWVNNLYQCWVISHDYNSGDIPASSIFNMSQQQKKKDTTARDIARKLKQIKMSMSFRHLCYVYTSVRTGGLYVYGHEYFTHVFEKHH